MRFLSKCIATIAVLLFLGARFVCAQERKISQMYELPAYSGTPYFYSAYTVQFNTKTNNPDWVAWHLNKERLGNIKVSRSGNKFTPDPNLGTLSPVSDDYTGSGYDRGHMCPANDCLQSGTALFESFYMSNVCPQKSSLNRRSWLTLEDKCHTWILDNFYTSLYIVCGPVPDEIDKVIVTPLRHIVVPKRFFKAIIGEKRSGGYYGVAFIFDQKGHTEYMSIDDLELIVHRDLFSNMPSRISKRAESRIPNRNDWPGIEVIGLNQ